MADDPSFMTHARDPMTLALFALREGDLRLAELILRALRREREAAPPRSTAAPSPLAHRTLDALLILLGVDASARRRWGSPDA
jgi:hypothetical protein